MHKIIIKTKELIEILDNSDLIKELKYNKNRLLDDKLLLDKIQEYRNENDDLKKLEIKKELYKNSYYKRYNECYNELSLIVLKINKIFSKITNTRVCKK